MNKPKQHQRLNRLCIRCGRKFQPDGKFTRLCGDCNMSGSFWRIKNKIDLRQNIKF